MLLDSHLEKKIIIHSVLGLPRWHKRIQYYFFKLAYIQHNYKNCAVSPNSEVMSSLFLGKFNENMRVKRNHKFNWNPDKTFDRLEMKYGIFDADDDRHIMNNDWDEATLKYYSNLQKKNS